MVDRRTGIRFKPRLIKTAPRDKSQGPSGGIRWRLSRLAMSTNRSGAPRSCMASASI
ncbi:hypothetical protein MPLA_1830178 [Mesorhizobium sp. ORS 3359]|nr:hypothetical protein MPLA_1830178 [Mesorhizobium sp. ORS 3359]